MFHNFLRIPQIVRSSYSVLHGNRRLVLTNARRLYSNDSSKKPPGDPKDKVKEKVNICVTSRKNPYDVCNPGKRRPCIPSPPPHNIGPRRCPGPSQMDMLPKPACPWDPEYVDRNKKFTRHLIMGLLFTALSLLALWYSIDFTKKTDTKVTKKERKKCRIPACGSDIPDSVPYLLIGGGTASFSAFRAIKSNDPTAKVLVVSNECFFPYMRPPLSKEMWNSDDEDVAEKLVFKQWNGTERSIFYEPEDFYVPSKDLNAQANGGVSVIQGWEVKKIDVVERIAYLDDDTQVKYDKCLIATGARAKKLDILKHGSEKLKDKFSVFRDIFDFQDIYDKLPEIKCLAIVGGGFLGSELACALGKLSNDKDIQVFQIFKENGNMGKVLPEYLSEWTTLKVRQEGVNIIKKTMVHDATVNDKNKVVLHLDNGNKLVVDHVISAIGVEPNTDLAKTSDLEVDPEFGGFLVNAEMEARSNLYIAGDCSCFYDIKLGRRRVEHHDHAVVSGRLAGENMTGAMKPYVHQSMFWSDLGPNIGYEAIGLVDSKLPTVAVFARAGKGDSPKAVVTATDNNLRSDTEERAGQLKVQQVSLNQGDVEDVANETSSTNKEGPTRKEDYGKGIIFYLRDDIVVGIVLWNVFNRMPIARQVLADERKYDDLNEVAKLFNIHED